MTSMISEGKKWREIKRRKAKTKENNGKENDAVYQGP